MKFNDLTPAQQIAIKKKLNTAKNLKEFVQSLNVDFDIASIPLGPLSKSMIINNILNANPTVIIPPQP